MKKGSNRLLKLIIVIVTFQLNYGFSRENIHDQQKSVTGTFFIVICTAQLDNGRPITTFLICKNLDIFKTTNRQISKDDFFCNILNQSILFEEPYFTIEKDYIFFDKNDEKQKLLYLENISKKINLLNKFYSKNIPISLNDGKIYLQIAKIEGDFWVLNVDENNLNTYSDSFVIRKECYRKDFKYNLKKINAIFRLNNKEINLLLNTK